MTDDPHDAAATAEPDATDDAQLAQLAQLAEIDRALEAWTALPPPADFADRVLAARDVAASAHAVEAVPARRRSRIAWAAALTGAVAAAGTGVVIFRAAPRTASGALVARERTTQRLGDRGTAVAEATSDLIWRIDDRGAADVIQHTGDVFYRVERGEPFVVHTPAGDVRVTGTCFRIEVETMNNPQKLLLSGVAGAAIASAVLITVYEGRVIAENRSAKTELAAGSTARLTTSGETTIASAAASGAAGDEAKLSREQLIAEAREQRAQLISLRGRLAELEKVPNGHNPVDVAEPGRLWHDPSSELLKEWVATCHVRTDEPALDRFEPLSQPDSEGRITSGDLDGYNAAMSDMAKQWKDLVRRLYIEITGDTVGADSLSAEAMEHEIEDKSPPGEHNRVLQKISLERAGQATAPMSLGGTTPLERMMRAHAALGDQSEAALAKRLGADRAHAVRGDGWQSRWESSGCPSP